MSDTIEVTRNAKVCTMSRAEYLAEVSKVRNDPELRAIERRSYHAGESLYARLHAIPLSAQTSPTRPRRALTDDEIARRKKRAERELEERLAILTPEERAALDARTHEQCAALRAWLTADGEARREAAKQAASEPSLSELLVEESKKQEAKRRAFAADFGLLVRKVSP